jgi:hypothetical protein
MSPEKELHHVFWTGGWDSTFRLLELIIEQKKTVQPHYIVSGKRPSIGEEMKSMSRLRDEIRSTYPEESKRILPVRFVDIEEVTKDPEIYEARFELRKKDPIGSQYAFLASYCKNDMNAPIDLCIEALPEKDEEWSCFEYLRSGFSLETKGMPDIKRRHLKHAKTVFQHFSMPYLAITKETMIKKAEKMGWGELLSHTWFCYNPVHLPFAGTVPCGRCFTCKFAIRHGMSWRVPVMSRIFSRIYQLKKRLAPN